MSKLMGKIQRKGFEQILSIIKVLKYEQMPKQVVDELAKYGIVKEENETMAQYAEKIKTYCREKEGTI